MKNSNESIEMLVEKIKNGLKSAEKVLNGADKQLVLEVGNHATKMVEFEVKRKTIQVTNGFVVNTPLKAIQDDKLVETNLLSRMLLQSIKQAKIKTKEFTVSIVSKEIIIREMDIPKMQEKELKGFLKINSRDIFPVNLANYVLGYNFIEKGAKNRIMIAAIPKSIIYPYIELGQKLGLTLKGVNYSGYELYNFLDYEIGIMHETYLAIDFGARNTNAIVIADGVLKFNKLIPKGLEQITEYICEELNCNVSRAEQLKRQYNVLNIREGLAPESEEYIVAKYTKRVMDQIMLDIVRIVEFYNTNNQKNKITKLYVIGSVGKLKGIEEYFNEKLNLKTKTLKMLQKLDFKKSALQLKGRQMSFINCLGATNLQDRKFVFFRDDLEIRKRSFVLTSKFHKLMACVVVVCIFFMVSIINNTNKLQEKMDGYQSYIDANGEILNKQRELDTRQKDLAEINTKLNNIGTGVESAIKLAQVVENVIVDMADQAKINITSYDLSQTITLTCRVNIAEGDNADPLKYINLPYNFRDNVINKFNAEVTDKKYNIEVNKKSESEFDIKIKEASNEN